MSSDTVVRGASAERAQPVVFGTARSEEALLATGPWADAYQEIRTAAEAAGRADGIARGHQQGLADGLEESRRRTAPALVAIEHAAAELQRIDAATVADLTPQVIELALELARLVLQRELEVSRDPGADALARVLELVPERGDPVIALHPDDLGNLGIGPTLAPPRNVVLRPDPSLQRGDAVVDVGPCRIDGRAEEALGRIARALRGEEATP
jgi:flagellar assembly protein FliH